MLGQDLSGWSMLDLFGGSGLMALEAASRGAAPVVVVERDARAAATIRENARGLGMPLEVRQVDAERAALAPADLVFLDPPYRDPVERWLPRGASLCRRALVMEARAGASWPERLEGAGGALTLDTARSYGDTVLAIYLGAE
jgi:16S rRNA G966 N2-methylase RsmD